MYKLILTLVVLISINNFLLSQSKNNKINLFVSLKGNDSWSGMLADPNLSKTDGPFRTLERARDRIREIKKTTGFPNGGICVQLKGGTYNLNSSFNLVSQDSGSKELPILYSSYPGEKAILSGGIEIKKFASVTDKKVLDILKPFARRHVVQADLSEFSNQDLGTVAMPGDVFQVIFDEKPLTLARWPNEGFAKIVDVIKLDSASKIKDNQIAIKYAGAEPNNWNLDNDIWLHGYWAHDWSDSYQKVKNIDTLTHTINILPPYSNYGYILGQRFYFLNILSELDTAGEYFLDRNSNILYLWLPDIIKTDYPEIPILSTLIKCTNVNNITFSNIDFQNTKSTTIVIDGGSNDNITNCTVRNTGSWGIKITNVYSDSINNCNIYNTGEGGISLYSGERKTLTKGNSLITNTEIHNFSTIFRTYRPAIIIDGVGNIVSHNLIYNAPHNAIELFGNDNIIEYNEIYNVGYETADLGAIYMWGDLTYQGNIVRYNYLHDIHGPWIYRTRAIHIDGYAGSLKIYGNIFYNNDVGILIEGGSNNLITNNLFYKCNRSIEISVPDYSKHHSMLMLLKKNLNKVPFNDQIWQNKYPKLISIANDTTRLSKDNSVMLNISYGGQWIITSISAKNSYSDKNNFVSANIPSYDYSKFYFQVPDNSPILKAGFIQIPKNQIGLTK